MSKYSVISEFEEKGKTYVFYKKVIDGVASHGRMLKGGKKYKEFFETPTAASTAAPTAAPTEAPQTKAPRPITVKPTKYTKTYIYNYESFDKVILSIEDIFTKQNQSYKIQIMFKYELQERISKEKRSFHKPLADKPSTISSKSTLLNYLKKINSVDLVDRFSKDRPNSKWQFSKFLSYDVKLTYLNFKIGCNINLPDFIKKKKNIVGLEGYNDNLCFWRCLAIHKFNTKSDKSSTKARELFRQYYDHKDYKKYEGINLAEIPLIEDFFKININIFQFIKNETTEIFIRSENEYEDEISVNLYKHHFSLIKNLKSYIKNYTCTCGKIYESLKELSKHSKSCQNGETKYTFPGGLYKPMQTVFERIKDQGIYVEKELRHNPYFICYDFEAMLKQIDEQQKSTQWNQQHVPLSVSICSNIPGYTEAICIVRS